MRLLMFGIAAAVVMSAPAQAEWKQYRDETLGVFNYFPVEPTKTTTTYKAPLAKEAPAIVLTAVDDGVTYKVEVVDFTKRAAEGANLLEEALNHEAGGRGGTFTVTDFPLWDKGANSVYGTSLVIDKKDKDKTHTVEEVVFNKGKLYLMSASAPGGSPSRNSPGLARFIDSSQFYLLGYGFNYETGHDYPLGDSDPLDRDSHPAAPNYKPPPGLVSGPLNDGPPQ
jgi:hypothetical protein